MQFTISTSAVTQNLKIVHKQLFFLFYLKCIVFYDWKKTNKQTKTSVINPFISKCLLKYWNILTIIFKFCVKLNLPIEKHTKS